ncbi:porin [Novosphingobium sp. ZN18A2]|uniref:porin n=1 Tax=Novosphingobium sp. ZN18A2 TaxID=3079861 RepID=UPI0030D01799
MLRKTLLGGTAAIVVMAVTAPAAYAGTSEALLKKLHDKGILDDAEYQALLNEEQAEEAKAAQAAATPAPAMQQAQAALDDKTVVHMTDSGIGFQVGDATITFSGSVNGFYVHDNPDMASATTAVAGGIANVGGNNSSAVRNGLLPGFLKVDVTTTQGGWDVGAHFGMYPGINSAAWGPLGANNGGQPTALATAGIDFRQTYLTLGRKGFGTVKIGRDIGLFGSDAILNDITLLSSGSPGGNVAPANTTLGRIGSGYIYTDFQPQITYTTPSFGGFQASAGVFQPLASLTAPAQSNSEPGFQGKLTYDGKWSDIAAHLWLSGITQKHDTISGVSYTGRGFDAGAKITVGPIAALGYYYNATGLGTTVLNLLDTDAVGNPRDSHGFYAQALATFGKIGIGGSYGASFLDYANAADALANPTLVRKNSSWVGQVRYNMTSWVTLIGEYVHSKAEAHNGNEAKSDALALGGILFF